MYKQQQIICSQSIIIPLQKLQKYYQITGLPQKQYKLLQYRQCLQVKPKTTYGAYSAESLIKLIRSIESNNKDFVQILAINTTLNKNNKKQFIIDKILREHTLYSYKDLLDQLHVLREQRRDQDLYRQMLKFIRVFLSKVKYLLYKYCQTLVMVLGECVNFYIRKRILSQNQPPQYSIVIGLDNICISFCSSNQFCQNILHSMIIKLKQSCRIDGFDLNQYQFQSQNLQPVSSNIFSLYQIPQYFQQIYTQKYQKIQQQILSQNNPQTFYNNLVINCLIKYSQDIFILIQSTIVFLANLVLQKKQLKNILYDEQFISMKHPLNESEVIKETFMNLYCEHFQGLPNQLYKNGEKCPYCNKEIIADQVKCYERNRNIFQNLLSKNYLNPKSDNVLYYFREKVFCLANKQRYTNYPHFCQFIKKYYCVRDRPQVLMLLQTQKITLYNKLWGKKRLFSVDQLIQTPVRGKYCRHLQFFQLQRVYQIYKSKQPHQTSFQCFLCLQPIQYTQLMYLHQIKLIIDLVRTNFYNNNKQIILNSYLTIDHTNQIVQLSSQLQKGYMRRTYRLPIYQTLIDPLTKSQKEKIVLMTPTGSSQNNNQRQKQRQKGNSNRNIEGGMLLGDDDDQFNLSDQFGNLFFGF